MSAVPTRTFTITNNSETITQTVGSDDFGSITDTASSSEPDFDIATAPEVASTSTSATSAKATQDSRVGPDVTHSNTTPLLPTPAPPDTNGDKLDTGAIAGVAVGAVLVAITVTCLLLWWFRRKRRRAGLQQRRDGHEIMGSEMYEKEVREVHTAELPGDARHEAEKKESSNGLVELPG